VESFHGEIANSIGSRSVSSSALGPIIFSDPEPYLLSQFRMAIERKNNEQFEESINDNPRFLLNTSSDSPTIIQGAQR
jgi:hypothetical protein